MNNKARGTKCPANSVVWTKDNEFWFPHLYVQDALKLVCSQTQKDYSFSNKFYFCRLATSMNKAGLLQQAKEI